MKPQGPHQHPSPHSSGFVIPKSAFFLLFLTIILLVIIYPPFAFNPGIIYESAAASFSSQNHIRSLEQCDLFTGDWIPNPEGPYYTNLTCVFMHEYQNCMKHERPDSDYLKWRWKPDGCDLPIFDPEHFLELMRGKSIAFVGDSMSRNQMQSLGCLLSRIATPVEATETDPRGSQFWVYKDYNFNMSVFESVHIIRTEKPESGPVNLYLDEFDEYWTSKIQEYDHIVIAFGQWYFQTMKFYENHRLFGCHDCKNPRVAELGTYVAYQKALRTASKAINMFAKPGTKIIFRTISPSHFEAGEWNKGGDCVRTRPTRRNETVLQTASSSAYSTMREMQMEEFKMAEEEGSRRGLRYKLLDVTHAMLVRPDGHPGKYSHFQNESGWYDCLHWCLPGPVDVWNDFLLQLLLLMKDEPAQKPNI